MYVVSSQEDDKEADLRVHQSHLRKKNSGKSKQIQIYVSCIIYIYKKVRKCTRKTCKSCKTCKTLTAHTDFTVWWILKYLTLLLLQVFRSICLQIERRWYCLAQTAEKMFFFLTLSQPPLSVPYLISSKCLLFQNIAHVGSFYCLCFCYFLCLCLQKYFLKR